MPNPYFSNLGEFLYVNRTNDGKSDGDYSITKNFFKRAKLREDIFQDLAFFTKYSVLGDDRPDNVADLIYGDASLDWVVLIANNIVNIQSEWPMSQGDFNTYVTEKYADEETLYSGIHHYEANEVKTSDGSIIIASGTRVSVGQSVSYFDNLSEQQIHEQKLNDDKRNIFVLKPIYLNILFDDLEEIMANKKGSTQFISETLVRGDNIRLYD